MVGEQAQEMQLAHWLPTTNIPALDPLMPPWTGVWFSLFPTVETLAAQFVAGALVLGSYLVARKRSSSARPAESGPASTRATDLGRPSHPSDPRVIVR